MSLEEVQVVVSRRSPTCAESAFPEHPAFLSAHHSYGHSLKHAHSAVCDDAPGDAGCWTGIVSFFSESGFVTLRRLWPGSLI